MGVTRALYRSATNKGRREIANDAAKGLAISIPGALALLGPGMGVVELRRAIIEHLAKPKPQDAACPYCRNNPGLDIRDGTIARCPDCDGSSRVNPGSEAYRDGVEAGLIRGPS